MRCVNPNKEQAALEFEPELVEHQLHCLGVIDTVRIRRAGFSYRARFADFIDEFQIVAVRSDGSSGGGGGGGGASSEAQLQMIERIVAEMQWSDAEYKIGKTKIFLREAQSAALKQRKEQQLVKICIVIQAAVKAYYARLNFEEDRLVFIERKR